MIHVHHLQQSRSERILWLLEELDIPYGITRYPRDPVTSLAPPQLRALHPLGKSPTITDGDRVLAESGAIVEYLIEQYGEGRLAPPRGAPERLRYTYWLHFAEGTLAPPLIMDFLTRSGGEHVPAARSYIALQYELQSSFIEAELGRSTWLAGEYLSGADIMMVRHLARLHAQDTSTPRPRTAAYLQRAQERPAYQRAMAKAQALA